jgi:general secretion pathway protein G
MGPSISTGSRRVASAIRQARGFTLIEILVVMLILVILAGVALARYANSVTRANEAVLKTDLFQMREALDQYYADKGKYPASLETLVEDGYVRGIPVDPFTGKSDTWQSEFSEPDPGNPNADLGVRDVKSGSDRTALDNTRYDTW